METFATQGFKIYTSSGVIRHVFVSCADCDSGSTTYQTVFEPERLIPTAQGEVGEALGTVSAHDSALKGAVQTLTIAKPHRKQGGERPFQGR